MIILISVLFLTAAAAGAKPLASADFRADGSMELMLPSRHSMRRENTQTGGQQPRGLSTRSLGNESADTSSCFNADFTVYQFVEMSTRFYDEFVHTRWHKKGQANGQVKFMEGLARRFDDLMFNLVGITVVTEIMYVPVPYGNTWSDDPPLADHTRIFERWWGDKQDESPKRTGLGFDKGIVTVIDYDDDSPDWGWAADIGGACLNYNGRYSYSAQYWHLTYEFDKCMMNESYSSNATCVEDVEMRLLSLWLHEVGHLLGAEHDWDEKVFSAMTTGGSRIGALNYSSFAKLQIWGFLNTRSSGNGCVCATPGAPCKMKKKTFTTKKVCTHFVAKGEHWSEQKCKTTCKRKLHCGTALSYNGTCDLCSWGRILHPSAEYWIPDERMITRSEGTSPRKIQYRKEVRCAYPTLDSYLLN